MYRPPSSDKTAKYRRIRPLADETRRARVLHLAADALEIVGHWDPENELTGPDVARLLGHPLATAYHYTAAVMINETCSGRRFGPTIPPTTDISTAVDILRGGAVETRTSRQGTNTTRAHAVIAVSGSGGAR